LRLRQQGDEAAAKRLWQALVQGFQGVPEEEPWVDRAKIELNNQPGKTATQRELGSVRQAVTLARSLHEDGKRKEAAAIMDALRELYRGDKQVEAILKGE
jgi:hypothetical protein